jgi:hypothetical protein
MNEFLQALGPFAWGFVLGYFWYPLWQLGKKIVSEAKLATQEWKNPNKDR